MPHLLPILLSAALTTGCVPEATTRGGHGDHSDAEAVDPGGGAGPGGRGGAAGGAGRGGVAGADAGAVDVARGADAAAADAPRDAGRVDGGVRMDGASGSADSLPASVAVYQGQCAICHGPQGLGTEKGPDLQHPVRDFATWVVRNGRTHPMFMEPMPKWTPTQISAAQLNEILDFLAAFPRPATGMGLFKDFCANCHGADAKGGVTMRNITLATVRTAAMFLMNVRNGHHAGEFSNRREYMPKWTTAQLSDAEVRLIFGYVDGLAR
jgi:mono/diheme cytochrome c family protein